MAQVLPPFIFDVLNFGCVCQRKKIFDILVNRSVYNRSWLSLFIINLFQIDIWVHRISDWKFGFNWISHHYSLFVCLLLLYCGQRRLFTIKLRSHILNPFFQLSFAVNIPVHGILYGFNIIRNLHFPRNNFQSSLFLWVRF